MAAQLDERRIGELQDWLIKLQDCLKEDEAEFGQGISETAYLQLLDTDLRLLKCGCLPNNIADAKVVKRLLTGQFFLQVNSVLNIGQSAYNQLQKIKGCKDGNSDENIEDSTEFTPNAASQFRTLYVEFTDGIQNVSGMEWQSTPCLDVDLKPGSKILVHGQVECRRGVLLLCGENTTPLGGKADVLLKANGQANLLATKFQTVHVSGPDESGDHRWLEPMPNLPIIASMETVSRPGYARSSGSSYRRRPARSSGSSRGRRSARSSGSSRVRRSARSSWSPRGRWYARSSCSTNTDQATTPAASTSAASATHAWPPTSAWSSGSTRSTRSARPARFAARSTRATYSVRFASSERSATSVVSTFPTRYDTATPSTSSATSATAAGPYVFKSDEEDDELWAHFDLDF